MIDGDGEEQPERTSESAYVLRGLLIVAAAAALFILIAVLIGHGVESN